MKKLYIAHLLRGVAEQFSGLFVFIFLFLYGQSHEVFGHFIQMAPFLQGILFLCLFCFFVRLLMVFILIPVSHVIKTIGLSKGMVVGNLFLAGFYLSLMATAVSPYFFILAAVFQALDMSFYWPSYLTRFALLARPSEMGKDVGSLEFLTKLLKALVPFIGGAVITIFGFSTSQMIAVVLILVSIVFLLLLHEVSISYTCSFKEFLLWIKETEYKKCVIGFLGKYIDDGSFILWSIFALIFFGSIERVGYVFSIVLFISLFISYFMGWYLGKHKGKKLLILSGGAMSALWVSRMFIQSIWHFIAVDVIDKLAISVYQPIFDMLYLNRSRERKTFSFEVYRELILSFSALFFWIVVALIFILPFQWVGLFLFASLGSFLSLSMGRSSHAR